MDDLTRMILRKLKTIDGTVEFGPEDFPGYPNERIQARVRMLVEDGLVHGTMTATGSVPVWGLTATGIDAQAVEEGT